MTISTSGIVPRIETLADDTNAALAISLHSARDTVRSDLMPINKRFPISKLKKL